MNIINSLVQSFNRQDFKQKILLVVLMVTAVITLFTIYINFLRPQPVVEAVNSSQLKPLDLNIKILESENFNNLKNNN